MSAAYQSFIRGKWRDVDRDDVSTAAQELCDPLDVQHVVVTTGRGKTTKRTAYRRKKNQ